MSMSGASSRRRIAARARLARRLGVHHDRAERFRRRLTGQMEQMPNLSELRRWPAWPAEDARTQADIWVLTALISARDSLLDEIDGARLRRYAEAIGEKRLEQVLALPSGGAGVLTSPGKLQARGKQLAFSALPVALAEHLGRTPDIDPTAAVWVAEAEAIAMGAA